MPLLSIEPYIHPEHLLDCPTETDIGRWWVLHTRPRVEKALARKFLDRDVPFFLPVHEKEWRNRGRLFRSYLPLFPGYVFLHGDAWVRLAALETNLVAHVLRVDDQKQLHADLRRVHQLMTTGAPITPEERLEPGDPVEIIRGPFAGLQGKMLRRGKQLRFFVEVLFLNRAVSMEIESWMIQSIAG